jgi:hypothetical protein
MAARYDTNYLAFLITKRLREIPGLETRVIHFKDADLESKFESSLAKSGDTAVIVRAVDGKNNSTDHKTARFSSNFTVTIFRVPLLQVGSRKVTEADLEQAAKDADTFIRTIIDQINGWWPDQIKHNGTRKIEVTEVGRSEEGEHDITRLLAQAL